MPPTSTWKYECVTGFFAPTDADQTHIVKNPRAFGLVEEGPDRWHQFEEDFAKLKAKHPESTFKVLYLGRHGQGSHNLKAQQVGEKSFLEKWGRERTDGILTWGPDPFLTHLGEDQARHVNTVLQREKEAGMPMPSSFYCSPLTRAAQTLQIAYGSVQEASTPLILEDLREGVNIWVQREWKLGSLEGTDPNTDCVFTDTERSPKSVIQERFPGFRMEEDFPEEDPYWKPEYKETIEQHTSRSRRVLDKIFAEDDATYIAISAHGGTCLTFQHLFGLKLQLPHTAAILPFIIKATPSTE